MRFATSTKTGKTVCLDCMKSKEDCICLDETEYTMLEIHDIKYAGQGRTIFRFRKNELPNGRKIPIWTELSIPDRTWTSVGGGKFINVHNKYINKLKLK